jgi:phospholipid-binding lipoprotein MlaA
MGRAPRWWGWRSGILAVALFVAAGAAADDDVHDPLEGMNRGVFWFNERVDRYFLEPVATAWDRALPDPVQTHLRQAAANLGTPVVLVNDVLQAKPVDAIEDIVRFVINSTLGLAGLFDPAAAFGVAPNHEDFGQTLGYWGLPAGPYLMLPFLGPSNPRDGVGLLVDGFAQPLSYLVPGYVTFAIGATHVVNERSLLLEEVRENRKSAFDFYAFVRNAYVQYRENLVADRSDDDEAAETEDDLYYLDENEGG